MRFALLALLAACGGASTPAASPEPTLPDPITVSSITDMSTLGVEIAFQYDHGAVWHVEVTNHRQEPITVKWSDSILFTASSEYNGTLTTVEDGPVTVLQPRSVERRDVIGTWAQRSPEDAMWVDMVRGGTIDLSLVVAGKDTRWKWRISGAPRPVAGASDYTPSASGGCSKGCRCGASCISCSKVCRGGGRRRK